MKFIAHAGRLIAAVCCLLSLVCAPAWAQDGSREQQPALVALVDPSELRLQVGLRGGLGIPLGDFSDNVGLSGGLAGDVGYRVGESPLSVGMEMSVLWYGRERRRRPFSTTVPDVLVNVTTSSAILMTHARLRVQPVRLRARPYADVLIGFNYVFTETTVDRDPDFFFEGPIARTTNFSDYALSAGGGVGLMIELTSWREGRVSIDVNGRYVYGGEADYLIPEFFRVDDRVADLEVHRSRTDLVMIHGGVAFEF